MNEREKKTILQYDVEALKRNVNQLHKNIKQWEIIVNKSLHAEKLGQAAIFTEATDRAREEIKMLQSYIRMIGGERRDD